MQPVAILDSDLPSGRAAQFDAFLRTSPFAAYQQSRIWTRVAPVASRHEWLYFLCLDGERMIGAAVIRRTRLSPGRWLATLQRGPVVQDPAMLAVVVPVLLDAMAAKGCCSVQLAPRVRGRDLPAMAEVLRANGFAALPDDRQPLHRATGIVWLDKPEAEILAGFKQRGRRQLKAADKVGVTIRPATTSSDIAAYQAAIDAFRASRPDYDMHGLPDAAGQAALIAELGGGMLLAELGGKVVGGHAFVRQADEAIWLSMATSADDPSVPRSYPLLWEGMRAARTMGCIGYDLAGIPIDDPKDAGEASRMQFKSAFSPMRRIMPPMQVASLKPVSHLVLFGARQIVRDLKRRKPRPDAKVRADVGA